MRQRQLPADPSVWTLAEREEVVAVHRTFREEAHGRRTLEILRRDLWDNMSALDPDDRLLDRDNTMLNEGRRHAYRRIEAYLDAYDYMTGTMPEAKERL